MIAAAGAPLRVGIDGRAFSSPAAGVRRYVHDLVPALLALDQPLEIVALGGDPGSLAAGVAHTPEPPHPPTNLGWTMVGLPVAASRAAVDLMHAPAYTAPFLSRRPLVVTIHDVSYERHPEWYPYRRDWLRRAFYRRSARAATRVITDSAFSKTEILAAYGLRADDVAVVPLGVSSRFSAVDADVAASLPAEVSTPFLLHVGDLHVRRNLPMLVDAVLEARRHVGGAVAVSLVLVGVDRGVGDGLCAMAAAAGMADAVVMLGVVGDDRLQALYRAATALVYPSLYEGFGLPVLEAMASGTPVLASSAASMPEVLGDAGILLPPDHGRDWTEAILRVMNDDALRTSMRARGLARAAAFTWTRTASMTFDVYRQAAAAASGRR